MPSVTTARAPPSALRTFQRSEGEPDAVPTVWVCERSLEGESEQNLERAKAHGGAAANVRRRRVGIPRATTPVHTVSVGSCVATVPGAPWLSPK